MKNKIIVINGPNLNLLGEREKSKYGNTGGYTHTSVAIHDALKILKIPIIELHITNIYNREDFRHKSLISGVASGIICGFGINGYFMSIDALKNIFKK